MNWSFNESHSKASNLKEEEQYFSNKGSNFWGYIIEGYYREKIDRESLKRLLKYNIKNS